MVQESLSRKKGICHGKICRGQKLSKEDYDHNTWATTKWFSFAVQQLSVTFHNAVAQEVFDAVNSADARASPVSLE